MLLFHYFLSNQEYFFLHKYFYLHFHSCGTNSSISFFSSKPIWNMSSLGAGLYWQTCLRPSFSSYIFTVIKVFSTASNSLSDRSSSKIQQKGRTNLQITYKKSISFHVRSKWAGTCTIVINIWHLEVSTFLQYRAFRVTATKIPTLIKH